MLQWSSQGARTGWQQGRWRGAGRLRLGFKQSQQVLELGEGGREDGHGRVSGHRVDAVPLLTWEAGGMSESGLRCLFDIQMEKLSKQGNTGIWSPGGKRRTCRRFLVLGLRTARAARDSAGAAGERRGPGVPGAAVVSSPQKPAPLERESDGHARPRG